MEKITYIYNSRCYNDGNVLPFRIDYINTIKAKEGMTDKEVEAINTEEALSSPERVSM